MSAWTWTGLCAGCKRDGLEVSSCRGHGERVLCAKCAEKPYRMPTATGTTINLDGVVADPVPGDPRDHFHNGIPNGQLSGGKVAADRYAGRVLDVAAMLAQPDEPIPWRCDGLAADGYLTLLAGRGGEGKSWLTLALASGVARGEEAAGIPCAKGRALIFDAENGARLITRRLRAAQVTADLNVQPVEVGGLSFTQDGGWFRQIIDEQKPQLVVFDSLRVLSSGAKESDSDEMEPIVTRLKQLARDTGSAIVLIHHRGKSESSEYRGSSVILDQVDLLFTLGRVAGDPEGRHRRKLTTVKCRIEEEPAPRWLAITADRAAGLVFVDRAEPFESEGTRPRDDLRGEVLGELGSIGRSARSIAKAVGRKPNDGTVPRILADLEADDLASRDTDGWVRHATAPKECGAGGAPSECPATTGDQAAPPHVAHPGAGGAPAGVRHATPHVGDGTGAPPKCRCERPLPAPDDEGELRCASCGRACDGWAVAA